MHIIIPGLIHITYRILQVRIVTIRKVIKKSNNEIESQEDCMEISEEEASESGNPQFRGQF